MVAGSSPLLKGAVPHSVSHPEELTLNFRVLHKGSDCCLLTGNATSTDGSSVDAGSMVNEGKYLDLTQTFEPLVLRVERGPGKRK